MCFSGDGKGEKSRPFEDRLMERWAAFDTFPGTDLSSPEVRLQKETTFSQTVLAPPMNLGEAEIPEILVDDRLWKLDSHMVLKDQISCLS